MHRETPEARKPVLIQEVILENFMSYEYARVPFKSGVNVVCGPNGAGKSSLLLAISVALGQSYTERSRKLSDLIRWGKDQARITLILDNTKKGGKRPVSKFNKDQIFLTRVLRRDGKYWFELENRAATKQDVERLLAKLGVDPDNMLIIMHQNMVEQFTVLSPQEKLRMVEAAVGLEFYRENVLQAQKKLTRILSQEESISKLLESAEQTLNYWREQYDRFQEKKQLMAKRRFLERELAWAEVNRREDIVKGLETNREKELALLRQIEREAKTAEEQLQTQQSQLEKLKGEWKRSLNETISLEREKAGSQATISLCEQLLVEASIIENKAYGGEQHLKLLKSESLKELIKSSRQKISKLDEELNRKLSETKIFEEQMEKVGSQILDTRVKLALLHYRMENAKANVERLEGEIKDAKTQMDMAVKKAEETGPRIAVVKNVGEILDEIRVTDGHLAALAGVSEDVERMYESYSKLYLELKEKAQLVAENREKALEEVKARMQAWRTVIQSLLDRVNPEYQKILGQSQAVGEVKLVNEHDIEAAGLEILVGFKGGKPVPLNAYTQSGGERTTATMSFLLALQQHVRSPFRAVDEYDVHMDPKNREVIAQMLISTVKNANAQYVVITPSQVTFTEDKVNIITVQNIEGKSIIKEVA
ncbi:MAG: AAA family ATPase [Candidatus Bathyarchaeota archaeon]|nr:AAA family ATPase [Candidatus Bathyarchaeota archaeon]